jgi:uncharacterized protein (TIGR03089 family)
MPKPPDDPAGLLRSALDTDPARPLVTFYDDATGERIELSVKTFANWVAKTANMLVDGLGTEPGERVAIAAPAHWQTAVWLFSCWSAGLLAVPVTATETATAEVPAEGTAGGAAGGAANAGTGPAAAEPDILVASEPGLAAAMDRFPGARDVVGLSLHPLGGPLSDPPPGVTDYATEVRAYADRFVPDGTTPTAPALLPGGSDAVLSGSEVVTAAVDAARDWRLGERPRVMTTVEFVTLEDLLAGLLAPVAAGGSVVICRNLDGAVLDHRLEMEHVTAVVGVPERDFPSWSRRGLISLPSKAGTPTAIE